MGLVGSTAVGFPTAAIAGVTSPGSAPEAGILDRGGLELERVEHRGVEQPALGEYPTGQEGSKLGLDVPRQPAVVVLAGLREEGFEMLADEAVEDGLGRMPRKIRWRESSH